MDILTGDTVDLSKTNIKVKPLSTLVVKLTKWCATRMKNDSLRSWNSRKAWNQHLCCVKPFNSIIVHEGRCAIVTNKKQEVILPVFVLRILLSTVIKSGPPEQTKTSSVCYGEKRRYELPSTIEQSDIVHAISLPTRKSGIRESNPPPKLGKLMHYRCANAAWFILIRCKGTTKDAYTQVVSIEKMINAVLSTIPFQRTIGACSWLEFGRV